MRFRPIRPGTRARRGDFLPTGSTKAVTADPDAQEWTVPTRLAPVGPDRPTMTDPARQQELEEHGFTVVEALDPTDLDFIRDEAERLGPAPDDPQVSINWTFHSRSADHKLAVKTRLADVSQRVVDHILQDHVTYLTTFITKWPGPDGGFAPHQDPSLVDERSFRGVTVWMPLTDTDESNGALHVVPGSHRLSSQLRRSDVDRSPFVGLDDVIVSRLGRIVATRAGEALVFDNRIIHYSLPNTTDRPRVVLSLGVRPSEAACILIRDRQDGEVGIWELDDDFYLDVLPMEHHLHVPNGNPIDTVRSVQERWTEEDLTRLCALVGDVPRARGTAPGRTSWIDPGAFCSVCGGSDGLDPTDRAGRNNAQLVCPTCTASDPG